MTWSIQVHLLARKKFMLQWFGEDICYLILSLNILQLYFLSCYNFLLQSYILYQCACFDLWTQDYLLMQLLICYQRKSPWLLFVMFNSFIKFLIQILWQTHEVAATYSTSQEESVAIGCFFELQMKMISPMKNVNPIVLFLSSKSSDQLLLVYPTTFKWLKWIKKRTTINCTFNIMKNHLCALHVGNGILHVTTNNANSIDTCQIPQASWKL